MNVPRGDPERGTAKADTHLVVIAGLSATFAESVSMGAVVYTATFADAAFYESERAREDCHGQAVPGLETDEIRRIYQAKGLARNLLAASSKPSRPTRPCG